MPVELVVAEKAALKFYNIQSRIIEFSTSI